MDNIKYKIGIRLEDYKSFECRTPLTPSDIFDLLHHEYRNRIDIYIQKTRTKDVLFQSGNIEHGFTQVPRCFYDEDFVNAGAILVDNLPNDCNVILGIKEIPHKDIIDQSSGNVLIKNGFSENNVYAFFSHTYKGQEYNEDMFLEMVKKKCTLIDYEMIVDNVSEFQYNKAREALYHKMAPASYSKFIRTVYFGKHAGIVGAINSLWVLGLRLKQEGIITPFLKLEQAKQYRNSYPTDLLTVADHHRNIHDYEDIKKVLQEIADDLKHFNPPYECPPFIIGITGKSRDRSNLTHSLVLGHSALGVKEIIDIFPVEVIPPETLLDSNFIPHKNRLYVAYFDRDHTEEEKFEQYLPKLTVLLNCLKWNKGDNRIVTRASLAKAYSKNSPNWNRVIGDISCDPGGSIEVSFDVYSDEPYYIYHPDKDSNPSLHWDNIIDREKLIAATCDRFSLIGNGPIIMSVTNLPCELPKEASRAFSHMLKKYVYDMAKFANSPDSFKDFNDNFDIARPLKRATMIYKGKVTPDYAYLIDSNRYSKLKQLHEENPCLWSY